MTLRTECDYCNEAKRVSELNARGDKMICDDCACDLQQLYRPRAYQRKRREANPHDNKNWSAPQLSGTLDLDLSQIPSELLTRELLRRAFHVPVLMMPQSRVTKINGSRWTGKVVGFYSTALTPIGYCVESENELGSVQIYPITALKQLPPKETK